MPCMIQQAIHLMAHKSRSRWLKHLTLDNFVALGLLTSDEMSVVQAADNKQHEVLTPCACLQGVVYRSGLRVHVCATWRDARRTCAGVKHMEARERSAHCRRNNRCSLRGSTRRCLRASGMDSCQASSSAIEA